MMWLTGRLAPDHKTIPDFRSDNGPAIKKVYAQFVDNSDCMTPTAATFVACTTAVSENRSAVISTSILPACACKSRP
jgi:hypothetical protein